MIDHQSVNSAVVPSLWRWFKFSESRLFCCAGAFGAFFLIVWFATEELGVGTTPDSACYLSTAANLRSSLAYRDCYGASSSNSPPLYSLMIATTSAVTFRDTRYAAPRLVCAVTFGIVGALTFAILRAVSASSALAAIGCLSVAANRDLVSNASMALTEIPFLALSIGGGLSFAYWLANRRPVYLYIAGVCFAAACLTRYVGIVWPAVAMLILAADRRENRLRCKLSRATVFGMIAYGPLGLWIAGWCIIGSSPGGRSLTYHPVKIETLHNGLVTLGNAVGVPFAYVGGLILAGVTIIVGRAAFLTVVEFCRGKSPPLAIGPAHSISGQISAYVVAYAAFLILSISLIDRATPLDGRILVPMIWLALTLFFCVVTGLLKKYLTICRLVMVLLLLFFFHRFLFDVVPGIASWHAEGLGNSHIFIKYDKVLSRIRNEHLDGRKIYSNVPWDVYLTVGKESHGLPAAEDFTSGKRNENYERDLSEIIAQAKEDKAIIIMDTRYSDPLLPRARPEFLRERGLVPLIGEKDCRYLIFGAPGSPVLSSSQSVPEVLRN